MNTLLVTSTEDGTGKTAIAIALAKLAQTRDVSAGYMKPKGTRMESAVGKTLDEDPMLAREMLDLDAAMHQLEPIVYSPTFIKEAIRGREDPEELRTRIEEQFQTLAEERDLMVLEGGGRLWTGGIVDLTDGEIAELLDAEVMLVSHYDEPADVDEILSAANIIGDRLKGVLFNDVSQANFDELTDDIMPFLDSRGIDSLGVVPYDEQLAGVTVEELADNIGADVLTREVPTAARIERFLVGAMGANAALKRLRRTQNAAVITGGDRSDIQAAALRSSGVNCLVLTGGHRPSNTILGTAAEEEVPILLVNTDTRTTIDRLESVLRSGRTQRVETVERMAELLEEAVDVDEVCGIEGNRQ